MDNDNILLLRSICDLLGVEYDVNVFDDLEYCDLLKYLLEQIYKFLGGK